MGIITQKNRQMAARSSIGDDELLLYRMTGSEHLSRLFQYHVELFSENHEVDFNNVIGEPMTVSVLGSGGQTRFFNGLINQFEQVPAVAGGLARYRATLVPWFWFLTRTSNCRIFQEMTIPEIIMKVFREHGFSDFRDAMTEDYGLRLREYCVQYNETDFNFVSRLMEEEGIYYFFEHEDGRHTLVLADSLSAHEGGPGNTVQIPYLPQSSGNNTVTQSIWNWSMRKSAQTGWVSLTDFDYKNPRQDLKVLSGESRDHTLADFEVFKYPGEYAKYSDGEYYAKVRVEEHQTQHETIRGEGNASSLACGVCFTLTNAPRQDNNGEYLITGATFQVQSDAFYASEGTPAGPVYAVHFTAIPSTQPFRPARLTPRPIIQGPQTAIIVGKEGEEVWTDELGRVKVKFHWDRYSPANEKSSCWVRVSQAWAGKKFGAIFLPRIGHEVIVEFLEGDPDRPIITGCVYNAENKPATELPKNKLFSGFKSNFSPNDNDKNSSAHLAFLDEKDDWHGIDVFSGGVFYQRTHKEANLHFEDIYDITIDKDKKEHVLMNRHEHVDKSHMEAIGGDRNLSVGGKEAKKVVGSQSLQVTGDVIEVFSAGHSEQVSGGYELTAGSVTINGSSSVKLVCGGSSIEMSPGSITIKSPSVKIEAPDTKVTSAITDITAGMIKLNAGLTQASGMVMAPVFNASGAVISPTYTPGAGNIL